MRLFDFDIMPSSFFFVLNLANFFSQPGKFVDLLRQREVGQECLNFVLRRASRTGAFIIEDDYDSEYRFDGRPVRGSRAERRVRGRGTWLEQTSGLRYPRVLSAGSRDSAILVWPGSGCRRRLGEQSNSRRRQGRNEFLELSTLTVRN